MWRPSKNGDSIIDAVSSRANRISGLLSLHRVHTLMQGLYRTANTCWPGLMVGAVRITCNSLCTAARFRSNDNNPCCQPSLVWINLKVRSSTTYSSRSFVQSYNHLSSLVQGLLGDFVTALHFQRKCREGNVIFRRTHAPVG